MDDQISRFWDKYVEKTKVYGVKASSLKWYVRYVEQYIAANKTKRLALHEADDIRSFLADIGRSGHLKDWQFQQLINALKILFVDIVKSDWTAGFSWDEQIRLSCVQLGASECVFESQFSFDGYSDDSQKSALLKDQSVISRRFHSFGYRNS